jgi:hypothetical protein
MSANGAARHITRRLPGDPAAPLYALFVIEVGSRQPGPGSVCPANQQTPDGSGRSRRGLPVPGPGPCPRQFTAPFDAILAGADIQVVKIPAAEPASEACGNQGTVAAYVSSRSFRTTDIRRRAECIRGCCDVPVKAAQI